MRWLASNILEWRMGCVHSRTDINDLHPNVFQVMNVDDLGNLITPGRLEVTEADIVLYQRGKPPVKWPLRCLRRYGYDAEIFSFESGRRCTTGPGIYAFKCRRAAQLFNLVQTNIQVCTNGDDAISRDIPLSTHPGPTRVAMPPEPNYLDPTPVRSNGRILSVFSHSQQNGIGRLSSIGSSSDPMSPQGTMGSPSPPPMLPVTLPPPPPVPQIHPSSLYVNEETIHSLIAGDTEHDNNKSLARRSMQRSHTVSSSTSSSGFLSFEQISSQATSSEIWSSSRIAVPPQSCAPSYMNVDLGSDASPLSPSHSTYETSTPLKEEIHDPLDGARTYMNISPGQERLEAPPPPPPPPPPPTVKSRPPALAILQQADSGERHCYANLEASEIEGLKKRFSTSSIAEKLPAQTPPAAGSSTTLVREMSYAVLDLDTKEALAAASLAESQGPSHQAPSPPDSPSNQPAIGYVTIDFNKTAALSHSVNSSLVNDNDEGSRKTRHNSTISELMAPSSTRHNSYVSE